MSILKLTTLFFIGTLLSFCLYNVALYLFKIITIIMLDRDMLYLISYIENDSSLLLLHNIPIFFIFIFSFYWTYFISSRYQRFKKLKYCNAIYKKLKYCGVVYKKENKLNKIKKKLPKFFFDADDYPFIVLVPVLQIFSIGIMFLYPLKINHYPYYQLLFLFLFLILIILSVFCICMGIVVQKIFIGVYLSTSCSKPVK
jgi:hypothetical protein